jgi:hypothetical protein
MKERRDRREEERKKREKKLKEKFVDHEKNLKTEAEKAYDNIFKIIELGDEQLTKKMRKEMQDIAMIEERKKIGEKDVLEVEGLNEEYGIIIENLKKQRARSKIKKPGKLTRAKIFTIASTLSKRLEKLYDIDPRYIDKYGKAQTNIARIVGELDKGRTPKQADAAELMDYLTRTAKDLKKIEKR